ncbi:MAG: pyruvate dehydrogenase complex dihydrolipoamide acetyltransferase [Rhizobiaceae bacterium]|nr:pyruvate dehydrogenase complex dihydrolipoamide acetyltransferase [Rhizobiaceae bacterium]
MPINITMPALSPTMEEGNLAKWHVKEGDSVSAGDVICEIETDKATMEVESIDEGVVGKILVAEGTEGVKVNSIIAVLLEEGESASDIDASVSSAPAAAAAPVVDTAPEPEKTTEPTAAPVAAALTPAQSGERLFASPLARRIAAQEGVALSSITGTGPHGRIHKRDVEEALAAGTASNGAEAPIAAAKTSGGTTAMATGMSDAQVLALYDEADYEKFPHDGMRRVIAERLTESTQTIPSYLITMDCELDALMKLRAEINAAAPIVDDKPTYKVSVNDFIVKAMAMALQKVPMANASWTSTDRILHKHSDVGVAVAVPDGLFTPIVRKAELKSLTQISAEVKDMAGRAKNKKLAPAEYQGGTTAVSNLGMFGVKEFTSIINPPHASILSVGAGKPQPVVRDGALAIGIMMAVTFAFDHRVIDGALGAQLAASFKGFIEKPLSMLV